MSKQREALESILQMLGDPMSPLEAKIIVTAYEALAEPELEFWPGDVLICKEDDSKVTVVNGNRGSLQLMNGKISIAWSDTVGGEYTIEQIKEMFYRAEKPEQKPVAWMYHGILHTGTPHDRPSLILRPEYIDAMSAKMGAKATPLYTAPPTQKSLTDEQIDALELPPSGTATVRDLVRIIERAHGIVEA